MKNKFLVISVLIVVASCGEREKKNIQQSTSTHQPDSNSVKLNNKAASLIDDAGHSYDSLKGLLYDSAIIYLDQAIEIDSLYLLAYTNKAQALQRKGSLEQALEVLYKVQTIKPDFAEVLMGQGFLLEKMDSMKLADKKYMQALEAYEKRLKANPGSTKVQSDIAFLYLFLEDQNKAIDEIQNLILDNPDSQELKSLEEYIKNFDRKKFIKEY